MTETGVYAVAAAVAVAIGFAVLIVLAALALSRLRALGAGRESTATELAVLKAMGQDLEHDLKQDLSFARNDHANAATALRGEVGDRLNEFTGITQRQLNDFGSRLDEMRRASEQRLEAVRKTVEDKLELLRSENAQKLEQMRSTVDEKLQQTLETRLGESFKLVSDRLDQVHRGLGEMQTLAVGVGDLKRVLTNVKSRGTWGEVQLGALLAEVLTPQQYEANVATVPGSAKRVEYAIRLPGRGDDGRSCWLPVDAKFPLEHWQRLQDAIERADAVAADESRKALADFVKLSAKTIRDSYVDPPHTTDFAILFVPTEGLYAELMSRPGFSEMLQREHRVTLTGPTNFLALLNSLQMGFRTLAIEQRSAEAWKTLGAVKTEFGKFGEVLSRAHRKIEEAGRTLDEARGKTTTIVRRLSAVESLPETDSAKLLADTAPIDLAPDAEAPPEAK